MRLQYDENYDDEGYLDDGDLPSLTPKGSNSIDGYNYDNNTSGEQLNMTRNAQSINSQHNNPEDLADDVSAENYHHDRPKSHNGRNSNFDDDGPDDEMAARRAKIGELSTQQGKSFDTDNSAPTDNDSHLTNEEAVEEEPYATSFCGQTLNAIDDMCGGNLNLTGEDRTRHENRRSLTTSPPIERSRRGSNSPMSAGNPRLSRNEFSHGEVQQENTAIEVEYMEPIRPSLSMGSDGATSDVKRKNVRLNALAKKAKEKFMSKKGKTSSQSVGSDPSSVQVQSLNEIESHTDDSSKLTAGIDSTTTGSNADVEQIDSAYNNFNASEKRKFIKLINSGVVAAIATRKVIDERNQSRGQEPESTEIELQNVATDSVSRNIAHLEPSSEVSTGNGQMVDVSTSSGSTGPFKKSGNVYYDAIRRDGDDDTDFNKVEDGNFGKTGNKGIEFSVAQRFFGTGKPKGFAALSDSPDKMSRSASVPSQRLTEEDGRFGDLHHDTIVESGIAGSLVVPNALDDRNNDMSANNSFDSFVRSRVITDVVDLSVETYEMTPTRDLSMNEKQCDPDLSTSKSIVSNPESVIAEPVINELVEKSINSNSESFASVPVQNRTMDTSNEVDSTHSTLPLQEQSQNVSHSNIEEQDTGGFPIQLDDQVPDISIATDANHDNVPIDEPDVIHDKSPTKEPNVDVSRSDEQSHGVSFISQEKDRDISRMDMSVNTVDASNVNDVMSVHTTGTSLTATTTYTQSSRTRRPGVAKIRLAKQKEIEQVSSRKAQGWHETIRAAAESTNRKWDPLKGWVDYAEPDIVTDDIDRKKEKIMINLNKSSLSHKEGLANGKNHTNSQRSVIVPFPREWEKERDSMIHSLPVNKSKNVEEVIDEIPVDGDSRVEGASKIDFVKNSEDRYCNESNDSSWVESMRIASASLAKQGMVWDPHLGWKDINKERASLDNVVVLNEPTNVTNTRATPDIPDTVDFGIAPDIDAQPLIDALSGTNAGTNNLSEVEDLQNSDKRPVIVPLPTTAPMNKLQRWMSKPSKTEPIVRVVELNEGPIPVVDEHGNIEFKSIAQDTQSTFAAQGDLYNDDIIIDEDGLEASRNVIEVVKQKVSDDDLELFPSGNNIAQRNNVTGKPRQKSQESVVADPASDLQRVNTSLISLDPSNMSSRRGAGPVDTDEVDETWESDDDERQSNNWLPDGRDPRKLVDLSEHHHIDGWRDNTHLAQRYDSRSVTTQGNDTSRSVGNITNGSSISPSKKIPKLQRSRRDTSPLSFRNPPDVAFPRSEESIIRHENIEIEYKDQTTVGKDINTDIVLEESVRHEVLHTKPSLKHEETKAKPSTNNFDPQDVNIVQARLKEWESRIETSHSTDNGENVEKSQNDGLLPVAVAGWKTFLGKKVQAEKKAAEARHSKPMQQDLKDFDEGSNLLNVKRAQVEVSTDDKLFHFTEKGEASALNLSDLSPIQTNDDLSDYDIASSAAYGPTEEERKSSSFLDRLTECAAPIMPSKTNAFCGRPDEAVEVDSIADKSQTSGTSTEKHRRSMSYGDEKPKSTSSLRLKIDEPRLSSGSVVSEDFGAKTAFLDALAMKAAVSKPKRSISSSRRHDQSGSSSIVSGVSDHSEKWKSFLERKKASGAGQMGTSGSGADVSRAAEKYAAEKVEEIMSKMAGRSRTTPRNREVRSEFTDVETLKEPSPTFRSSAEGSTSAAEDLAAARVEAMMAALSTSQVDEGEI